MVFNEAILYKDRTPKSKGKKSVVISLRIFPKIKDDNSGTQRTIEVGES